VRQQTPASAAPQTGLAYLIPKHVPDAPLRTLVPFEKFHLKAGEPKPVQIAIPPRSLSLVAPDGTRTVQPGDYDLYLGGGQPAQSQGLVLPFHIAGSSGVLP
jgi:beta-glucosidase